MKVYSINGKLWLKLLEKVRPNGLRQPRAGGLALRFQIGNRLERIPARKIAPSPASRLHAVLARSLDDERCAVMHDARSVYAG